MSPAQIRTAVLPVTVGTTQDARMARPEARAKAAPEAGSATATRAGAILRGQKQAQAILARGSKSFALAGALLGSGIRQDAAVLYAWCRLADDRLDLAPSDQRRQAVTELRAELDAVYRGSVSHPLLVALHDLVTRIQLPRAYLEALIDGFAMDAEGAYYSSASALDLYAYHVAGVVGLMMCQVLGVRDQHCLPRAAHLGMAMQLTNICRDVVEDWRYGRQYLPLDQITPDKLRQAAEASPGADSARATVALTVAALLERADGYYESGLKGLNGLGWRSALAIGAAARIYRAIGRRIAKRRFDVFAGRAVVSLPTKLVLAGASAVSLLRDLPRRLLRAKTRLARPTTTVRFSDVQNPV